MISLGEMIAYLPVPGGHIKLAERFVDPALSFTMGWNYWYNWTIILPAELSAAATLMHFWVDSKWDPLWIIICFLVVIAINLLGAGAYGEAEFIFASIKVLTVVGLIVSYTETWSFCCLKKPRFSVSCSTLVEVQITIESDSDIGNTLDLLYSTTKLAGPKAVSLAGGPSWYVYAITSHNHPQLSSLQTQAAFSFIGTEIVAIAAGEAKNPRRNLPRAIKRIYIRILLFYIGGTAIIGLLVPSNDDALSKGKKGTAAASPFVIA